MNFKIFFLIILILTGAIPCSAQFDEALLNKHLKKYECNFTSLMQTRGLNYITPEPNLATLLKNLKSYNRGNAALSFLFYHHENDTLHIWCISQNRIEAYHTERISVNELRDLEIALKQSLKYSSLAKRGGELLEAQNDLSSANYILSASKHLIPENIADVLLSKKFVLVMPSLNIGSFPFYILKPWKDSTDLIDRLTLAVIPSFSDLYRFIDYNKSLFQRLRIADSISFNVEGKSLVIGDPSFKKECGPGMKQLPGAGKEALVVADKLKTVLLTKDMPTPNEVLEKMRGTDLLYFACHGFADDKDPLKSGYLLLSDEPGNCGKLTAFEIQNSRLLPMSLVFLSACRTGSGKTLTGGVIGVSRAFIIAGASNVVMSLWDVNDKATGEMMPMVIDSMFQFDSFFPAAQMRNAILAYRKQNPKPRDWGAFSIFGVPYPTFVKMNLKIN